MNTSKPKTVITYGTFDIFHIGHLRILQRARELGDRLVVGCSTDEFNAKKGKTSVFTYGARRDILESCRFVDKVFPEEDWAQKRSDIITHEADVFVMGDDWAGKFDDLSDIVEVAYLPRTQDISTTEIREMIKTESYLQR